MKKRKQYSDEFKAEAVAMVSEQGRSITDVSQSLSVGATVLRRWVQLQGTNGTHSTMSQAELQSAELYRIKELEKQVKTLQKERDDLKKSIAFFAKQIEL